MTDKEKKQLANELQDTFDSIQDGAYTDALDDLIRICAELGHPIHDEQQEHPDTDWHRAGCSHCQYIYDSKLPDSE